MFFDEKKCISENIKTVFHLILFAEIPHFAEGTGDATPSIYR